MGIFNFIMKKIASSSISSIVGIVDTIANQYLTIKASNQAISDQNIYEEIIKLRYAVIPLKENWRYVDLLKRAKEISELKLLIFEIITNESPELISTGNENLVAVLDIIQEQLKKYNLK